MLRKLRMRIHSEERGFTLIELLVVILIIGILAAVALPSFLGQQKKGQDGESKSNVRNLVSQIESCFADNQSYLSCNTAAKLGTTGLNVVTGTPAANTDQVSVAASTVNGYTATAASKSGNTFSILKNESSGITTRSCTTASEGGCKTGSTW